jgi:hypothetical protein
MYSGGLFGCALCGGRVARPMEMDAGEKLESRRLLRCREIEGSLATEGFCGSIPVTPPHRMVPEGTECNHVSRVGVSRFTVGLHRGVCIPELFV